MEPVKGS